MQKDSSLDRKENLVDRLAELFRGATRPIVTVIFAATIAQVVVERIDAPEWFLAMAGVVILEWWGERVVTRIKDNKTTGVTTPTKEKE